MNQRDPNDNPRLILDYMAIDLRIEEWLRGLEEILSEYEFDEEDRAMVIYYMRLAYIQGHRDGRKGVLPLEGA